MITKNTAAKHVVKEFDPNTVRLTVKAADGESGTLEGYASVFGNIDLGGDVIRKGAFAKTLSEQLPKGQLKLMDSHQFYDGTGGVIGIIKSASEDDTGLRFDAMFSKVARAQDVRTKVQEGILNSLSIGFDILNASYEVSNGAEIRVITEVKLYEISVVIWGMNPEARITGAKMTGPLTPAEREFLEALKARTTGALTLAKSLLSNTPASFLKTHAERIISDAAVIDGYIAEDAKLTAPGTPEVAPADDVKAFSEFIAKMRIENMLTRR